MSTKALYPYAMAKHDTVHGLALVRALWWTGQSAICSSLILFKGVLLFSYAFCGSPSVRPLPPAHFCFFFLTSPPPPPLPWLVPGCDGPTFQFHGGRHVYLLVGVPSPNFADIALKASTHLRLLHTHTLFAYTRFPILQTGQWQHALYFF